MKKLTITLALLALPSTALAAGIDISWDDCVGGAPQVNEMFDCTANANYNLNFQFKLAAPMSNFVALTAFVDYQNASNTPLTPFWHFEGGGCPMFRAVQGLVIDDNNVFAHPTCWTEVNSGPYLDPWNSDGTGGTDQITAYGIDWHRPGNGYLLLLDYRSDLQPYPLVEERNYWAFRLNFRTANRGACPGCTDAGVIVWEHATFEGNDGSPAVWVDYPDKFGYCVTINGDSPSHCGVVPVKNTTWGQLKSMYR